MQIIVISWILGLGIIGINIYYLTTTFIDWILHNGLHILANVFVGIVVFPLMVVYIMSVVYLMFRKDVAITFVDNTKLDSMVQTRMETGDGDFSGMIDQVLYREELADIPLPR